MKTSFADVNDSKDTWTVHAKVLRKWVVRRKTSPYAVWKIGMILVDEEVDFNLYYHFNALLSLLIVLSLCHVGIVTLRGQSLTILINIFRIQLTRIEVTATHKNLIEKWTDEPKEGLIYKFQNFQVLENDDKYRVTTHQWRFNFHTYTYVEESDVDISDEAYNFKSIADIQQRNVTDGGLIEYGHLSNAFNATLVTLNPKIVEANLLKERLSQDSVGSQLFTQISNVENPTYSSQSLLTFRTRISLDQIAKIDEECDVVTKVTIQKVETLYGWSYDACPCDKKPEYMANGILRCSKCNKDVLMTVPKYKIHYKVYDDTGKCSIIFFDRHATELLGKSASKIKEDMIKEGRNSTVPEELDEVAGKVQGGDVVEESTDSKDSIAIAVEDDDNSLSQLITPTDNNTKRKKLTADSINICEDFGLSELSTPKLSSTKPVKNIKKEKL
ncbi:hypothetical protein K1719_036860 [Acacia pycnantha]|nr:hypothetical protein K1719_036860 [Acacia pycnantha]